MDDAGVHRGEGTYRALFEALEVPVTVHELIRDADGVPRELVLLASNRAHDRLMGQARHAHVGRTTGDVAGATDHGLVAAAAEVLRTGEPRKHAAGFPDGRIFDLTLFRIDERTFGITGEEISSRLRAEAERERLLLDREELVRTISHDLRAPLTSISTQAQLLARNAESERVRVKAHSIVVNARRMADMIRDLVDTARADAGVPIAPVALELGPFVADLVARLDGGLESARIRLSVPPELPVVHADPARLERALVNLLLNALRHGPPDTPVELTAAARPGAVTLEVADHGAGISPDDLPRIFDRFYRSSRTRGEGLGLGLHIARRFVEAHGGTLEVRSEEGRGATFRVTLPLDRAG